MRASAFRKSSLYTFINIFYFILCLGFSITFFLIQLNDDLKPCKEPIKFHSVSDSRALHFELGKSKGIFQSLNFFDEK